MAMSVALAEKIQRYRLKPVLHLGTYQKRMNPIRNQISI